MNFYKFRRNRA